MKVMELTVDRPNGDQDLVLVEVSFDYEGIPDPTLAVAGMIQVSSVGPWRMATSEELPELFEAACAQHRKDPLELARSYYSSQERAQAKMREEYGV